MNRVRSRRRWLSRRWIWAAALACGALAIGLASTFQAYYGYRVRGRSVELTELAAYTLPDWFVWAALVPIVVWLGRRVRPAGERWKVGVTFHVGAALLFAFAELFVSCALISWIVGLPAGAESILDYYRAVLGFWLIPNVLIYGVILAGGQAYDYWRKFRHEQLRTSELEAELATARLRSLESHLRPHFLFNVLHSVGVLIRLREYDRSLGLVTGLGDLLRHALEHGDQEVALGDELAFVRRYLEVEKIRFGERLEFDMEPDPGLDHIAVPNLVIQPLVAASIRRAVSRSSNVTHVEIRTRAEGEHLSVSIRVRPGETADIETKAAHENVELLRLQRRLAALYGRRAELVHVVEPEGTGVTVLRLPAQVAAAGEPRAVELRETESTAQRAAHVAAHARTA